MGLLAEGRVKVLACGCFFSVPAPRQHGPSAKRPATFWPAYWRWRRRLSPA